MNIFGPKSLSHILFYLFRGLAGFCLFSVVYYDISFLTGNFRQEDGRYFIELPLIGTFMTGDYQFNVILTVSLILLFATIFFFVLSNIFRALKHSVIFNPLAVKSLSYFTFLNLVLGPVLYLIIHFVIMKRENYDGFHNFILFLIFGIVSLFITNIVKKGTTVQSENDLTI